jgi:hypothetical protein
LVADRCNCSEESKGHRKPFMSARKLRLGKGDSHLSWFMYIIIWISIISGVAAGPSSRSVLEMLMGSSVNSNQCTSHNVNKQTEAVQSHLHEHQNSSGQRGDGGVHYQNKHERAVPNFYEDDGDERRRRKPKVVPVDGDLKVMTANVTSLRARIVDIDNGSWACDAHILILQEVKVAQSDYELVVAACQRAGWKYSVYGKIPNVSNRKGKRDVRRVCGGLLFSPKFLYLTSPPPMNTHHKS